MNNYLMIGTVLKPQGVHGECKIRSYAADIERFRHWQTLYTKAGDDYTPVSVRIVRIHDGFVYAVLNGCDSADKAEKYRSLDLFVSRAQVAPAEKGAELIADLIGCNARDELGEMVGTLTDVLQYGTVDTWVFTTSDGVLMVPALKSVFPDVDVESKSILVVRERLEEVAVRI